MTVKEQFFTRFNSQIVIDRCAPGNGSVYEVRMETKAEKNYAIAEQKAAETLSEEQMEKWYDDHEIPGPEYKSRMIPADEDWDAVDVLMAQSLNANTDLLWERYKDNVFNPLKNVDY